MRPAGHSLFASSFFFGGYIFLLLLGVLGALRGSENLQRRIGFEADPALAYLRGSAQEAWKYAEAGRDARFCVCTEQKRRFRGVDATNVTAAGPASQPRRVHWRRSLEAVGFPNAIDRVWGPFMGRTLLKTAHRRTSSLGITEWWNDGERVRGKVPTFPHPEGTPNASSLFSCRFCPAVAADQVRKNRMSLISRGRGRTQGRIDLLFVGYVGFVVAKAF